MAVIDRKKLVKKYQWNRLSASARALLDTFERFTDPSGEGSPTWGGLMYYSGISGKDTFKRARKQLLDIGLITIVAKSWTIVQGNGKRMPRPRITYQITKDILWEKRPKNQSKQSNYRGDQSMVSGSMDLRKEEIKYIDVNNNYIDASNKPTAGSNQIKQEKTQDDSSSLIGVSFGRNEKSSESVAIKNRVEMVRLAQEVFYEDGEYPYPLLVEEESTWREAAILVALYLRIDSEGDSEWFGFFKKVYEREQQGFLNEALFYTESGIDDIDIKDIRKVFFSNFYIASKEVEE